MCGITGIIGRRGLSNDDGARLAAMTGALAHRGPDGAGEFRAPNVALAMRRLSIIDLEGGWQPLYNEDRSLALVFNGEIYNFVELRRGLEARGHTFSTGSDGETILHLYEEHGAACVEHLRGMFAFALWDEKRRRVVLARDRMGEKPLYLYERDGVLLFASELKSLLASGLVPFELDPVSVDLYFHYQYVPEPRTPLRGVRKLDAAHILTVDVDEWRTEERCYWRPEDAPPLEGDPATLIREELDRVSELIVRSDVPVGVALSSGLDSSAIAALAARKYPGTMRAFSVGYPGHPQSDERADAQALADHLGMPFHDVELVTEEIVDFFPELTFLRDDPIADISGFGYYAVSKLAREHGVPVILQGQGGDELFWGYGWVQQAASESIEKDKWLRSGRGWEALAGYLSFAPPVNLTRQGLSVWLRSAGGLRAGWQRFQRHRTAPAERVVFYDLIPDFRAAIEQARGIYSPAFIRQINGADATNLFTFERPWPTLDLTLTRLICDTYLRENGIAQGDRLSMASSIELRLPLVDYRLVETVVGLRKARTDLREPPKAWLRAALEGVLPDWVMNRRKRGFTPPVMEWHKAIFAAHGDSLTDGYLVGADVLNPGAARRLSEGTFPHEATTPLSFKALVLEQWARRMSAAC
jgi:asparagine synthase (glutamine-hydrolysing)